MKVLAEHHSHPRSGQMGNSDHPLIQRVITAHTKSETKPHRADGTPVYPRLIQHAEWEGREYVVLWWPGYRDRFLSVYRVRAYDGVLRKMKRPPQGLCHALVAESASA